MPNDYAQIILAATHSRLTKVRDYLAIADTINALKCTFEFRTNDWDGTQKTAIFVAGKVAPNATEVDGISVLLDETDECDVPYEVLEDGGVFSVGVYGTKEGYRIPTNWLYFKIKDGAYMIGSTPSDPTPSVYEQILNKLDNFGSENFYTKNEINELLNISNGISALDAGSIIEN